MMAATAIRDTLVTALPTWRVQFGRWTDDPNKATRFAVVRPVGGGAATLVRSPQFSVTLIGADGDDATTASAQADLVVRSLRAWRPSNGAVFNLQASEPVFVPTADSRPAFDIAVSALTT